MEHLNSIKRIHRRTIGGVAQSDSADGPAMVRAPEKKKTMKITFETRLEAIDWIADYVDDEGQFEVLREQLNFNFIYTGTYFLDVDESIGEVASLDKEVSY